MESFVQLTKVMNKIADVSAASAVLGWDQETYMPEGAVEARAEQLATLSSLVHQFVVSDSTRKAIDSTLANISDLSERQQRVVRMFDIDVKRASQLPSDLVEEMARVGALAQDAWKRARATNTFSIFQPLLERTVELKRKEAEIINLGAHLYDSLLDSFEPGLTVSSLTPVFDRLRLGTTEILKNIQPKQQSVSSDVLYRTFPAGQQMSFAKSIIAQLGFSGETGRVDLSAHPFCTSFSNTDVRLTTRIRENDLRSCLFGLIHEAGHGMYEQGIGNDLARTASGTGASMGIHESQSLFWENMIARSEEFWQWAFPKLKSEFPEQLADETPESFFKAINKIIPSLNRVESDELTYNLHIILRFEIERDLIASTMEVKDIPAVWNAKMEESLGVVPPTDSEGCLQDVHWSFGGIGYFPSYTLGKLYAAMEWNELEKQMPDVRNKVANGDFAPIREWLRVNIHDMGRTEFPSEIIRRVTGRDLTETDFLTYIGNKAGKVYGL